MYLMRGRSAVDDAFAKRRLIVFGQ